MASVDASRRRVQTRREARQPWPPPDPIAPAGRTAAFVTASCLVLAGLAFASASIDELFCRGRVFGGGNPRTSLGAQSECDAIAGLAGAVILLGLGAAAAGVVIAWRVRRRGLLREGGTGWKWGEGVVTAIGLAVLATRIPRYSCPPGFDLDGDFALCISATARLDAAGHGLERMVVIGAGVVLGVALARLPWIPRYVAATITLGAWFAGMGWLLYDTMGGSLSPG